LSTNRRDTVDFLAIMRSKLVVLHYGQVCRPNTLTHFSVIRHLRDKWTDSRNRIWYSLALKSVVLVLMIFLIINRTNFVYLLVNPGFYHPFSSKISMKQRARSFPHRMDATDRRNRHTGKQTNGRVRLSLRWSLTLIMRVGEYKVHPIDHPLDGNHVNMSLIHPSFLFRAFS